MSHDPEMHGAFLALCLQPSEKNNNNGFYLTDKPNAAPSIFGRRGGLRGRSQHLAGGAVTNQREVSAFCVTSPRASALFENATFSPLDSTLSFQKAEKSNRFQLFLEGSNTG